MELSNQEVKLPDNHRLLKRFDSSSRARGLELAVNAFMAQFGIMLGTDPQKESWQGVHPLNHSFHYIKNWRNVCHNMEISFRGQ